ncbi:hypothetical protein OKW41_004900 [Paraburkholderia sp. UCT70]
MLLFLDTEYTGFGQRTPRLISPGIVAEDASREFYIEFSDTWQIEDCSDFVKREVLPLLEGAPYVRTRSRSPAGMVFQCSACGPDSERLEHRLSVPSALR